MKNKPASFNPAANELQWVSAAKKGCDCDGHYRVAPSLLGHANPKSWGTVVTQVKSQGPVLLKGNGESVLRGNVVATQPGRRARGDTARITYNKKASTVQKIVLKGHVRVAQGRDLVVGQSALLDLQHHHYRVQRGWYRLYVKPSQQPAAPKLPFLWGRMGQFDQSQQGNVAIKLGSVSTCPPINPFWQVQSRALTYNKQQQSVEGRHGVLKIKGVSVLYLPSFSFSTSSARRSGWLRPSVDDSSLVGVGLGLPYYWNLAPNYDLLLTPTWWSKRGAQLDAYFRYITSRSKGTVRLSGVLDDRALGHEKNDLLPQAVAKGAPYVSALQHMSRSRGAARFLHHTQFNSHLQLDWDLNWASDPYYLHDFSLSGWNNSSNQLLNQVMVLYTMRHGSVGAMLQWYQTLHQANQLDVSDQYRRLPQVNWNEDFSVFGGQGDLGWGAQFVSFGFSSDYQPAYTQSIGLRWHARPRLSYTHHWGSVTVRPSLLLDTLAYSAQLPTAVPGVPRVTTHASRATPMGVVSLSGRWGRTVHFRDRDFWQIIEPRLQYEYVPFSDQSGLPNFDSSAVPFSYSRLYALNAFSGFDRLEDTNQLSMGLESELINQDDGSRLLSAGVGVIDYFSDSRVLSRGQGWSPMASQLTLYPYNHFSASLNGVWQPGFGAVSEGVSVAYRPSGNRQWDFAWNQLKDIGKNSSGGYTLNSQAGVFSLGMVWPINEQWNALGYYNYNLTEKRAESYFFGIQYDSCCWTVRTIFRHYYSGVNVISTVPQYGNAYYVQFMLKGLGGVSSGQASNLLSSAVPGFEDPFK